MRRQLLRSVSLPGNQGLPGSQGLPGQLELPGNHGRLRGHGPAPVVGPAEGGLLEGRAGGRLGGRLERTALGPAGTLGMDDGLLTRSVPGFGWIAGASSPCVLFLWSRQHSAHRHSMTKSPFSARRLASRQPNCALMSV